MNITAEIASRGFVFLLGCVLFLLTLASLLRTVVVPRHLRSVLTSIVMGAIIYLTRFIARLRRTYLKRDSVLAWSGPLMILALLLFWLLCFILSYGLLIYGVSRLTLGDSIRQAGASLLTLGFAGAGNGVQDQTIIDFIAATTGPVVIALMIGYLPTIYQTYLEREVLVSMISAEAGEPAWGPEFLSRVALSQDLSHLSENFDEWAQWSARLRLTHMTYPMLLYVRSARGSRHYIATLTAMLDAGALVLAVTTTLPRASCRRHLLQGSQALQTLYGSFFAKGGGRIIDTSHIEALSPDERIIAVHAAAADDFQQGLTSMGLVAGHNETHAAYALTRADFDFAIGLLTDAHFPIEVDSDTAWETFRTIRAVYELPAYGIMRRLDATPAPWTGPRDIPTETMWPTLATQRFGS